MADTNLFSSILPDISSENPSHEPTNPSLGGIPPLNALAAALAGNAPGGSCPAGWDFDWGKLFPARLPPRWQSSPLIFRSDKPGGTENFA
jgi:hypothetical protein